MVGIAHHYSGYEDTATEVMNAMVADMGADPVIIVRYMTTNFVGSAANLLVYDAALIHLDQVL